MLLDVSGLTKTYGAITAVDGFDLELDGGEIVAVAGPDGAGKTSLFRALAGLIRVDSGDARVDGLDVRTEFDRIKPLLGYMPQSFSLYADLSVEENMRFYAGLFGIEGADFRTRRDNLYEFSGLSPFAGRRAGHLSGGMKQKLALSCALIHQPRLLILDEPTTGVDPLSRRQFWHILQDLRSSGSGILVSTPYMDEVGLADRAVLFHRGKDLARGTPGELVRRFRGSVFELRRQPTVALMERLAGIPDASARRFGSAVRIATPEGVSGDEINANLAQVGVDARAERVDADLEDVFVQLMGA
ncbi:MAG: ABC transporter ATP-binding protein [bacterium]